MVFDDEQRRTLHEALGHESGHAIAGHRLGAPIGSVVIKGRLPDGPQRSTQEIGGITDVMGILVKDQYGRFIPHPDKKHEVALVAIAGATMELLLANIAVDADSVFQVLRLPRNSGDYGLGDKALGAAWRPAGARNHVERVVRMLEGEVPRLREAVNRAYHHVLQHAAHLPYALPSTIVDDLIGTGPR